MAISFEAAAAAHQAGDLETAERGYRAFPNARNAIYNLARIYRDTDRLAEAEAAFRRLLKHDADFALARRGLAMTLLAQRREMEAWPYYEARREILGLKPPPLDIPEWQGEPMAGKTLLVLGEQGLGDQLMFARFAAILRDQGVRVVMAGDPRLRPLFDAAGFVVPPQPSADAWAHACSLPLRMGLEGVAGERAAYLRGLGGPGGGGVGVMARGNPEQHNDQNRSMDAASAQALTALGRDLSPEATGAKDMAETAGIIAGLDLVVSVCTSVAHLALAMGKPCWLLGARTGLDWRWNDGLRSDWYPAVRIFRQDRPREWGPVLERVRAELAAHGLA
ncbi:hypothetical protein [Phenylobacterium sp.]|jgi:hypothetical protein|uniref:hypothetical protein n=1 Tax=Phenylobacterium sp. TaxID=1871053 RepID=UPI002F42FDD1